MRNVFKPKRSNTQYSVPNLSDLYDGELAVNIFDRKIFIRSGLNIVELTGTQSVFTNVDGGVPNSIYGGINPIDGGGI